MITEYTSHLKQLEEGELIDLLFELADARVTRNYDGDEAKFTAAVVVALIRNIPVPWSQIIMTRQSTAPLAESRTNA